MFTHLKKAMSPDLEHGSTSLIYIHLQLQPSRDTLPYCLCHGRKTDGMETKFSLPETSFKTFQLAFLQDQNFEESDNYST
jgi:hypothetical protein